MDASIDCPMLETLAVMIACSQIVVAQPRSPIPSLPGGFDEVDIAVLDWIAAEGRTVSRRFMRIYDWGC
jgi:hypothetical protein